MPALTPRPPARCGTQYSAVGAHLRRPSSPSPTSRDSCTGRNRHLLSLMHFLLWTPSREFGSLLRGREEQWRAPGQFLLIRLRVHPRRREERSGVSSPVGCPSPATVVASTVLPETICGSGDGQPVTRQASRPPPAAGSPRLSPAAAGARRSVVSRLVSHQGAPSSTSKYTLVVSQKISTSALHDRQCESRASSRSMASMGNRKGNPCASGWVQCECGGLREAGALRHPVRLAGQLALWLGCWQRHMSLGAHDWGHAAPSPAGPRQCPVPPSAQPRG